MTAYRDRRNRDNNASQKVICVRLENVCVVNGLSPDCKWWVRLLLYVHDSDVNDLPNFDGFGKLFYPIRGTLKLAIVEKRDYFTKLD